MPLDLAIERSRHWVEECASLVNGITFETTNRKRVAVSLFHLCIEHQAGIHTLVEQGVNGSAFALLRSQIESYVRGVWYHHCATEEQVSSFVGGANPPKISLLIEAIERLPGFNDSPLTLIKRGMWRELNDFTHGGTIQVKARNSRDEVASNWKHEHIAGLLESAVIFSTLGAAGIATVVESDRLAQELQARYQRIYEPVA